VFKSWFLQQRAEADCRAGKLPRYLCRYLEANRYSGIKNIPLAKIRFVVLDTETTGLDIKKDKIISIAAVAVRGSYIIVEDSFETLVRQKSSGEGSSVVIHGLLRNELKTGASERFAMARFLRYIQGDVLVAHNMWFDKQMLNMSLRRTHPIKLLNPTLDVLTLAIRLEQGQFYNREEVKADEYTLDALCERYGISIPERHTAAGDAFATAMVFQKLLAMARHKNILTLGDLMA
jgi:DNA polymerase III subunit epsilon